MTPEDAGVAAYMAALEEVEIVPPLTHAAASELISRAVVAGVRAAVRAAIAAEREACALVLDTQADAIDAAPGESVTATWMARILRDQAHAIRARGTEQ